MPQTLTPAAGFTLDAVAENWNTHRLTVQRLVALGKLPATNLGDDWQPSKLRITSDTITKYINSGAPDFTPPQWQSGWFKDPERAVSDQLTAALANAAEAQVLTDAQVIAKYNAALEKTQRGYSEVNAAQNPVVKLTVTAGMRSAAEKPIDSLLSRKYKNAFQALAASRLRLFAKQFIGSQATLERLYSNEYPAIVAGALEMMAKKPVVHFSVSTLLVDGPERGALVRTSYELPFSSFDLSGLAELAF